MIIVYTRDSGKEIFCRGSSARVLHTVVEYSFPYTFLTLTKKFMLPDVYCLCPSCVSLCTIERCTCEPTEKQRQSSWHHLYFTILPSFYSCSENVYSLLYYYVGSSCYSGFPPEFIQGSYGLVVFLSAVA